LLENGANPNAVWGTITSFIQAIRRDVELSIIESMIDHKGDPFLAVAGYSPLTLAAQRGRGDVLDLFINRGFKLDLEPFEALVVACARNDEQSVRTLGLQHPSVID